MSQQSNAWRYSLHSESHLIILHIHIVRECFFLSTIVCPWLNFGLPPRCPQVVWCLWGEIGPFSAMLAENGLVEPGKIPWNIPPWLGIEPGPRGGQTVSYPTDLTWLTHVIELGEDNSGSTHALNHLWPFSVPTASLPCTDFTTSSPLWLLDHFRKNSSCFLGTVNG